MKPKVAKVFRGFAELTDQERSELIEEINKFQRGDRMLREIIKRDAGEVIANESTTINFGPAPGGCPCCGR